MEIEITPSAYAAIKDFTLPQGPLPFGKVMSPIMLEADFDQGIWGSFSIQPLRSLTLSPTCKVFHYAQEIFEGMKAYYWEKNGPFLFRPEMNIRRFNFSAERMAMPTIDENLMLSAIKQYVLLCRDMIPTGSGDSLYLRPMMIATEEGLGIKPSAQFKFLLLASPSGSYFQGDSLKVKIEKNYVRACPGGVGNAKTGGNYARGLKAVIEAKAQGFHQILWADALEKKFVEEMEGMNFFVVIDGELCTPPLSDTILAGVTRESLIHLARQMGQRVSERKISILELMEAIRSGRASEAFACGTAAIIGPISAIGTSPSEILFFPEEIGPVARRMRQLLLDIQEGRAESPPGWRVLVEY